LEQDRAVQKDRSRTFDEGRQAMWTAGAVGPVVFLSKAFPGA
jgi:hypothetical protein